MKMRQFSCFVDVNMVFRDDTSEYESDGDEKYVVREGKRSGFRPVLQHFRTHAGCILSFSAVKEGCWSKCQIIHSLQYAFQSGLNTSKLFLKVSTGQINTPLTLLRVYFTLIKL